jgi:hypothetical protein
MMDGLSLSAPLTLLLMIGIQLMLHRHAFDERVLFALSGIHLGGLLVIPPLGGAQALHLGLWDGLFALSLLQWVRLSDPEVLKRLLPIAAVGFLAHLMVWLAAPQPDTPALSSLHQGVGLMGFALLALQFQTRAQTTGALLALGCGLVAWSGPDEWLSLGLKAALVINLLQARTERQHAERRFLEESLVKSANQLEQPFRMTAQALFHVPVPILLVEQGSREVLYANGMARATLRQADWSRRPLPSLFLALQPSGANQEEALVLEGGGLIQRVLLHVIPAPGEAGALEIISVTPAPLQTQHLSRLLIEEQIDIQGTGRCLTDGRFSIVAASAGWQQIFGRLDRYFQSGVVWDKLRMSHPEASLLLKAELELERSKRTQFDHLQPHGPRLHIEAIGFRDADGAWWYLFQVSSKA